MNLSNGSLASAIKSILGHLPINYPNLLKPFVRLVCRMAPISLLACTTGTDGTPSIKLPSMTRWGSVADGGRDMK